MTCAQRFTQGELSKSEEVLGSKEVGQSRLASFRRIDFAFAQSLPQCFGRNVDEDDLVSECQDAVGQGFPYHGTREAQDRVAQPLEMLDVQRRDHVDPGAKNRKY